LQRTKKMKQEEETERRRRGERGNWKQTYKKLLDNHDKRRAATGQ
jgi:hypothetical protein